MSRTFRISVKIAARIKAEHPLSDGSGCHRASWSRFKKKRKKSWSQCEAGPFPLSRPNHEGVSREWAEQKFGKLALWPSVFWHRAFIVPVADSLSRSPAAESGSTQCTLCPRTYLPSNMLPTQHGDDFSAPFSRGYTEIFDHSLFLSFFLSV